MNYSQTTRFSEQSLQMLKKSGWHPNRDVLETINLPSKFQIFPDALQVLREFGYLQVGESGPGITCARSTIIFDPMVADGEDDRFSEWSEEINSKLYPLGSVDNRHAFLAIDEKSRVFLVMNFMIFMDSSFDMALDKLLTGVLGVYIENEEGIPDIENL